MSREYFDDSECSVKVLMMFRCRHPHAVGLAKLPCRVTFTKTTESRHGYFRRMNVTTYDPSIYRPMQNVENQIACGILCFKNGLLAAIFNSLSGACLCHVTVATRPPCSKRRPLLEGSFLYVKKVGIHVH